MKAKARWMSGSADCEEDGIAPFREEDLVEQKRLTLRVPHHIDSRLTIVARQHSIFKEENQLIVDVLTEREVFSPDVNRSDAAWHPTFCQFVNITHLQNRLFRQYPPRA